MKYIKPCLLSFSLLSVFISPATLAETTKLGWSTEQATTWTRMKDENHPLFQRLKSRADGNLYTDLGIYDGLYYLVTGDSAYAKSAYATIKHLKGKDGIGSKTFDRNGTRHNFGSLSMIYSWVADELPAADKAHFKSILEYWAHSIFHINGTRAEDSDESTGHYLGLAMFAIAIKKEDPALSSKLLNYIPATKTTKNRPVGGLDVTGNNRDTMRNTIADYVRIAKGGVWLEGSEYNSNTPRYLTEYSMAINKALGTDKFPEITKFIPELIEAEIQMLTPSLNDLFQHGDIQQPHSTRPYHRVALISFLAHHSKDPRLNTIFDKYYSQLTNSENPHFLIYANPYAPRAPITGRDHNAPGRGLAYHHSGWGENDSFFSSAHFGLIGAHHEFENETNFGLYRNGEWIIDNPRGYTPKAKAANTMLVSGGIFSAKEGRGQTAYEAGDDFLYHVGSTGGHQDFNNYYNPPPESLHEWTRSYLYVQHKDKSDSVIIFDRLNNSNPMTSDKFDRYHKRIKPEITLHNAATQLVFHMPNSNLTESGDTRSWKTDKGQDVSLTSFLSSSYTTRLINEKTESAKFLGPTMHENQYKYQLRLVPSQKSGHQTMMNIVHTGSDAQTTRHTSHAGEKAEAVLIESGAESTLAIFNGDAGERPFSINGTSVAIEPTQSSNNFSKHDPLRQDKNARLRYFKTGFNLNFKTTKASTNVYLMDLDPSAQWKATIDGSDINLTPSDAGALIFKINSAGSHSINILKSGVVIPQNKKPTTQGATYTLKAGSEKQGLLKANDADDDTLSYHVVDDVSKGTLVISPTGAFTYTSTDANATSDQFTFKVNDGKGDSNISTVAFSLTGVNSPTDTVAPVITLKGDNTITLKVGQAFVEPGYSAIDAQDGTVTVSVTGSVDTNKVGTYSLKYSAKDAAGNISDKTRNVIVVSKTEPSSDKTPPVITIIGDNNITVLRYAAGGKAFVDPGYSATDNRDGVVDVVVVGNVDLSKEGEYTLEYSATDNAGNVANKSRTVVVAKEICKDDGSCVADTSDIRKNSVESSGGSFGFLLLLPLALVRLRRRLLKSK